MLRTDRSLLKYILLSIVTLGLYSLWFWSQFAKDMNTVCDGDGRKTRGILARIILSFLTVGIYNFIWMYGVGDRIYHNCHMKNIACDTTGSTVVLWYIVGSIIIIGPFMAIHKMLEGLNLLCYYYNNPESAKKLSADRRPANT